MIRSSALVGHRFLADSLFTSELFARDYFLIRETVDSMRASPKETLNLARVELIHEVLLFHQ
jgi:hypothetical protein